MSPVQGRSWSPGCKDVWVMEVTHTHPTHPDLVPNAPLARFTTIRVGGPADWLAETGSARAVSCAGNCSPLHPA